VHLVPASNYNKGEIENEDFVEFFWTRGRRDSHTSHWNMACIHFLVLLVVRQGLTRPRHLCQCTGTVPGAIVLLLDADQRIGLA